MAAGIEDVARRARVSTATVSRALRGLPHVSEPTRERVRVAAAELGYVASPSASSLATGRTRAIGVVTPWVARWFFAELIEAAETTLRRRGYDALLYTLNAGPYEQRPRLDTDVLSKRVDGVVVVNLPLVESETSALRRLGCPVTVVGFAADGAASVRIDEEAAADTAMGLLIAAGHRRIAHIGGDPADTFSFAPPAIRREGWRRALRAVDVVPERSFDVPGYFTVEGGRSAMARLLALPSPPTAVFAASDEMAIGALSVLRDTGAGCPVSVVGMDDHPMAALWDLTTVGQDVVAQGVLAATLVLEGLAGMVGWQRDVVVPVRPVVRGSVVRLASAP